MDITAGVKERSVCLPLAPDLALLAALPYYQLAFRHPFKAQREQDCEQPLSVWEWGG